MNMTTREKTVKNRLIRHRLHKSILASIFTFTLLTTPAWAEFSAEVNTQSVAVNDVLELTLTTDNHQSLPDLAPLEQDFQIISMSQSRLTHIVNGRTTYKYSWVVTLSPKVVGQLTIPMLRLGNETTLPITINSLRAGQVSIKNDESISITAEVPNGNHYIFQEIPLTIRVETTQSVNQAELIMGDVPDVDIRQDGEDKVTRVVRQGQPIIVLERQYVLSPQKTGRIEIPPITVRGNFLQPRNIGGHSGFNDLFDQQIREHLNRMGQTGNQFDSLFSGVGPEFTARTDPVILDIQANPNGTDAWFLPAQAVTLTGEWQPQNPTFKEGEAVTRKIELLALGAQPEQLPTLDIPNVDGLQIYIDSDTTDRVMTEKGMMAKRTMMLSIIPEHGGTFTLPELSIDWQNVSNNTTQRAVLPSEIFNVEGGAVANSANSALTTNVEESLTAPIHDTDVLQEESYVDTSLPWWQILSGLVLLLVLTVLGWIAYKKLKQSQRKDTTYLSHSLSYPNVNSPQNRQVERAVDVDQRLNDALNSQSIEKVYQALSTYKQVKGSVLSQQSLHKTNSVLQQLEAALYGSRTPPAFQDIVVSINSIMSLTSDFGKEGSNDNQNLPNLYPY